MQRAADDPNTLAVIGGVISSNALAMGTIAKESEIPLFTPTATSQSLAGPDYTPYVIKGAPLDNYQIEAIKELLKSLHLNNIAVIYEDSSYGKGFYEGLNKDESIEVAGHYGFPSGELSIRGALSGIQTARSAGARIGVLATYDQDAKFLLNYLGNNSAVNSLRWIMTDGATLDTVLEGLPRQDGNYLPYLYGVTPSIARDLSYSQDFATRFESEYGYEPTWFSYYAYDTALLCFAAFGYSPMKNRKGIWEYTQDMSFTGVSGSKCFDENGMLQSAVYDTYKVVNNKFAILGEIRVTQPSTDGNSSGKTVSSKSPQTESDLAFKGFTYTLNGDNEQIGHVAGDAGEDGVWIAQSRDSDIGWVLMAFYEDATRGEADDNRPFGFRDTTTYHLNFDLSRDTVLDQIPVGDDILQIKVTSVRRYHNQNGAQQFATKELLRKTVTFEEWQTAGDYVLEIPVVYESASPDGAAYKDEDNLLNWEFNIINAAHQEITIKSVVIEQRDQTGVQDFMLH